MKWQIKSLALTIHHSRRFRYHPFITFNFLVISSCTSSIAFGNTFLQMQFHHYSANKACSFFMKIFFVSVARFILLIPQRIASCNWLSGMPLLPCRTNAQSVTALISFTPDPVYVGFGVSL